MEQFCCNFLYSQIAISVKVTESRMTYERYICPVCKAECHNPEELREHRLAKHKNIDVKSEPKSNCP